MIRLKEIVSSYSLVIFLPLFLLSACVHYSELTSFNRGEEFPNSPVSISTSSEIEIQPKDELNIVVYSEEMLAAAPFNLGVSSDITGKDSASKPSDKQTYLVDDEGNIDLPTVGRIKLGGLNITEAKDTVKMRLKSYLTKPIVHLRFINFKVTILGEVRSPGSFLIRDEKITVLDALGLAGDFTDYADRSNLLVIREQNGKREFGNLDLQDRSIFQSSYFYLKQNDVVIINPIKEKTANIRSQAQIVVPWIAALTSLTSLIITVIR